MTAVLIYITIVGSFYKSPNDLCFGIHSLCDTLLRNAGCAKGFSATSEIVCKDTVTSVFIIASCTSVPQPYLWGKPIVRGEAHKKMLYGKELMIPSSP